MRFAALTVITLFSTLLASAQDLTGTWEGTEEGNYMKLVIVKVGNSYVGYTYDTDAGGGWCRANFAGSFNTGEKKMKGSGQGMIAMQGSHVQCDFDLSWSRVGSTEFLIGTDRIKNSGGTSLFDRLFGGDDGPVNLRKVSPRVDTTEYMRRYIVDAGPPPPVRRTAPRVIKKTEPAPKTAPRPVQKPGSKPVTAKTKTPPPKTGSTAPAPKTTTPVVRTATPSRDTVRKTATVPPPRVEKAPAPVNEGLLTLKKERRSSLVQEIETTAASITIRVYDNGVFDGDTVSILHNNVVIADHRPVTVTPYEFTISLDDSPVHDITLIAHNLGTIAPNTASLTIIAGDERYRLTASTDLGKNAIVRIRKKP